MTVPNRPAAGALVDSAWGQIVHDAAVALDVQTGHLTTHHAGASTSALVTVSFPRPFASSPVVLLSSGNYNYVAGLNGVRSAPDRFSLATKRVDDSKPTADIEVDWLAIGPRA